MTRGSLAVSLFGVLFAAQHAATLGGEVDDLVPECPACGTDYQFTKAEIGTILTLHNKMRKAVGSPPLKWDCKLMCQAQEHADGCQFKHSDCYNSPIKAGESIATGNSGETAAWMWFSEYGDCDPEESCGPGEAGHFTALVWKATAKLGCGRCETGKVYVCQYTDSAPNFGGKADFDKQVPPFQGSCSQYEAAGLDCEKAKEMFSKFKGWGLSVGKTLEWIGAADLEDLPSLWQSKSTSPVVIGAAASLAVVTAAVLVAGLRPKRTAGTIRVAETVPELSEPLELERLHSSCA